MRSLRPWGSSKNGMKDAVLQDHWAAWRATSYPPRLLGPAGSWCFCRHCHHIHQLSQKSMAFQCEVCREETVIAEGMMSHGALCCPWCSTTEPLISVAARTSSKPRWKLFALETIPENDTRRKYTMADRAFQTATAFDHQRLDAAQRALQRWRTSSGWRCIPDRKIGQICCIFWGKHCIFTS
jgi:hypothetical protein